MLRPYTTSRTARQKQIASGKWSLYTETTYYQCIFTDNSSIFQLPNSYDAEFKFAPTFKDGRLAGWRIPIWPMFHQDQYRELNLKNVINYFAGKWGTPEKSGKVAKWIKGNTMILVEEQVVDNGPYGMFPIPVVIFAKI